MKVGQNDLKRNNQNDKMSNVKSSVYNRRPTSVGCNNKTHCISRRDEDDLVRKDNQEQQKNLKHNWKIPKKKL